MSETMVVNVDGVRVEGEVERSRRQIDLRIVSPYRGLSAGLHIAVFIPIPPAPDFTGPDGERHAVQMLVELYRAGKFVEEHRESLRQKVKVLDAAIARLDHEQYPTEDDFRAFRRGLRRSSVPEPSTAGSTSSVSSGRGSRYGRGKWKSSGWRRSSSGQTSKCIRLSRMSWRSCGRRCECA